MGSQSEDLPSKMRVKYHFTTGSFSYVDSEGFLVGQTTILIVFRVIKPWSCRPDVSSITAVGRRNKD